MAAVQAQPQGERGRKRPMARRPEAEDPVLADIRSRFAAALAAQRHDPDSDVAIDLRFVPLCAKRRLGLCASQLATFEPEVHMLHLGGCQLGDRGLKTLLRAVVRHAPRLQHLSLPLNGVSVRGCQAVAEAMVKLPRLSYLSLRDNPGVGDKGVGALTRAFKTHLRRPPCMLAELSLEGCGVSDAGAACLAKALMAPSRPAPLATLNLRGNPVGDEGAAALGGCLAHQNRTLTDLYLGETEITLAGARRLVAGVDACPESAMRHLVLPTSLRGHSRQLSPLRGKCALSFDE